MSPTLEERKLQYIETVEAENMPGEKSWWQYPAPAYHHTRDYAANYDKEAIVSGSVIFRKARKEWMIAAVILVVASVLIYLIGEKEFGFTQFLFLVLLLLVVLPGLLDNKAKIRVSRESIWLYKEDKEIRWEHVLLTYIKEVREEHPSYFFIVHYYDDNLDEFHRFEIGLDKLE